MSTESEVNMRKQKPRPKSHMRFTLKPSSKMAAGRCCFSPVARSRLAATPRPACGTLMNSANTTNATSASTSENHHHACQFDGSPVRASDTGTPML